MPCISCKLTSENENGALRHDVIRRHKRLISLFGSVRLEETIEIGVNYVLLNGKSQELNEIKITEPVGTLALDKLFY